jgi:hypothetical protein
MDQSMTRKTDESRGGAILRGDDCTLQEMPSATPVGEAEWKN